MNKYLKFAFALIALHAPVSLLAQSGEIQKSVDDTTLWMLGAFGLLFFVIVLILSSVIRSMAGNGQLWKPKPDKTTGAASVVLLSLFSIPTHAVSADAPVFGIFQGYSNFFWTLVIVDLMLVMVIVFQLRVFRKLIVALNPPVVIEEAVELTAAQPRESWFKVVLKKLNPTVPVELEEEVMTEHEYDGIRELDNVLPPWWVAMFYASIVFSVIYLAHYHVFKTGDLQIAEYHKSIEKAEQELEAYLATVAAQVDEHTATMVIDAGRLSQGEKIYTTNCAACHGMEGQGGVGPNLVDQYWIHGGSINDVFAVIKYGVPSKGMISWQSQLAPTDIQNVASYLLTFQGTDPPNQKEPEGELYIPITPDADLIEEMATDENNSASTDSLRLSLQP